jgi:endonuclease YncB( thermonuclease family)
MRQPVSWSTRLCLLCAFAGLSPAAYSLTLRGPVEYFFDGDSFVVDGQSVRLKGIDAPESAQTCADSQNREYRCGDDAADHLVQLVGRRDVDCRAEERDDYGRLIAYCRAGSTDLNSTMVRDGWAVAFVRYDDSFAAEETDARKHGRGIWRGAFQRPREFRAEGWRQAGKKKGKTGADCPIKGNISSDGDRIYHTPWGSRHYHQTRINTRKGERWFCTEAEARAAGWRPPRR